jgi:hypothetical protein
MYSSVEKDNKKKEPDKGICEKLSELSGTYYLCAFLELDLLDCDFSSRNKKDV